jgi:hypothetical protein
MTLTDLCGNDPLDSDEDMPLASISGTGDGKSLFSEAISYGGEILDAAGDQVMFSVGEAPVVDSSESNRVWRDMENLEYYDHTIFADMTPMMADLFDKTDDCTVSDAVRAMAAMGEYMVCTWTSLKICNSGLDESDEEDGDDGSLAGESDSNWAPHGSKSVGSKFHAANLIPIFSLHPDVHARPLGQFTPLATLRRSSESDHLGNEGMWNTECSECSILLRTP